MHPFLRFLNAARSLQRNQGLSKADILNFAKNEFGEITGLMRAQIDNLFKTKKPVGKKDPVFDNTVEKMQFDDAGKPFNPRDPLKKADGGRISLKDGIPPVKMPDPLERILKNMTAEERANFELMMKINASRMPKYKPDPNAIPPVPMPTYPREDRADGGITRVGLKDGQGMFEKLFYNKAAPILSGFNTSELFDLVANLSSAIPFADGGRAAFKDGPKDPRRRGFMKTAVGIASMLPFGIGKGVKMAAPVVEKAAEISGPALAKIVETVMSLGKTISISGKRVKEMVTKKRLKDVEVEEDVMDGSYIIKKGDKEIYYKPGRRDEMGIDDDIIEVIDKTVTKKASGGIAGMLGE